MRFRDMLAAAVRPWVHIRRSGSGYSLSVGQLGTRGKMLIFSSDAGSTEIEFYRGRTERMESWASSLMVKAKLRSDAQFIALTIAGNDEFFGYQFAIAERGRRPVHAYCEPLALHIGELSLLYVSPDANRRAREEFQAAEKAANDSKVAA